MIKKKRPIQIDINVDLDTDMDMHVHVYKYVHSAVKHASIAHIRFNYKNQRLFTT